MDFPSAWATGNVLLSADREGRVGVAEYYFGKRMGVDSRGLAS